MRDSDGVGSISRYWNSCATPTPDLPKRDAKTDHPATPRNADAAAGGARPVTETASARGEEII